MPRDYKHRTQRRRRGKSSGTSPWLGVIAGLLVGLLVAFLVFIKMQAAPVQQVFVKETLPTKDASVVEDVRDVRKDTKEAIPSPPKPRFDFYTLLPEMEVVVPEQEITGKPEQGVKQVEQPGTYYLQVGSFRNGDQADRFKAELALLGLETSIQKVTIDNQNTWNRVRVGPFDDLDNLNRARQLLSQRDIESTLVKIRN
ncbi:MAG: SPOR domain-containing protein [Gammaproteobacteria bacterium]|nr:SPOR domain-containing protein [Gammaproteobacteria bacterium]